MILIFDLYKSFLKLNNEDLSFSSCRCHKNASTKLALFILDHTSQLEEVVAAPDDKVVGIADKGHHVGLYLPYVCCHQTF